jgi:hypothetical protein
MGAKCFDMIHFFLFSLVFFLYGDVLFKLAGISALCMLMVPASSSFQLTKNLYFDIL